MRKLRAWILRIGGLFDRQRRDRELEEEIESHLQLHMEENLRLGMTPEEARRQASMRLGGIEAAKEAYRDQRGLPWLETLWRDIGYGARQLRKNPGFTSVAVMTLALGIGANTAMFSFVNAVLLRPLPYAEPGRLVMVFENNITNGWSRMEAGIDVLNEWRRQNTVFESLAARTYGNFALTGNGRPETLKGSLFSANMFSTLGLRPMLGRDFLPSDETPGNEHVVILSHELWQRRFGGDGGIIGKSLTLGGEPFTVIGVMPRGTVSPDGDYEMWAPIADRPPQSATSLHNLEVYGRLKAGVSLERARAEMAAISRRLGEGDPRYRGWDAEVHPLQEIIVGGSRRLLLVLLAAVSLVLLVGCTNTAGLLLARAAGRAREFDIRAALGAGRGVLIRQLLTESCLLAAIGGIVGLLLARLGLAALIRLSPPDLPRMNEGVAFDANTLGFTILVTLGTGIVFGMVPAFLTSRPALARSLAETAQGGGGRRQGRLRSVLVVAEVALSMVLLVAAGLTLRSFGKLLSQDLGFVPERLVTMSINPPAQGYPGPAERRRLFAPLLAAVREIPGVDGAGYAFGAPLTHIYSKTTVGTRDQISTNTDRTASAGYAQISPGYFATMKTRLLQGRDFTEQDGTNSAPVAIVDQTLARKLGLGDRIVGQRINVGDGAGLTEIVGVVADSKRTGLAEQWRGEIYRPYRQVSWGVLTLVVRTQRDPADITRAIRGELDRFDKDIPLDNVRTMPQLVAANVLQRRLSVQLLGGFAGTALFLAALGLYGVLGYMVILQRRELGIRLAIGAQRGDVLRHIMGRGCRLAALGLVFGLAGAFAAGQILRQLLYETAPTDLPTLLGVSALLLVVSLFACWVPAWRASMLDPMRVLRLE